jgi:repressor LexA
MTFLTDRQREVLDYIQGVVASRGVAPTLREISEHFGFSSTASAQKHVALLVDKGLLNKTKHQKRGLELSDEYIGAAPQLPLLGTVAAGSPIESWEGDDTVAVPPDMLRGGEHYVLKVRGDSMVEDGIHDGDLVVVQRRNHADEGEVVVALVDRTETTLKRFSRPDRATVRLEPANAAMAPIVVAADRVLVQGVVVGLLRRY